MPSSPDSPPTASTAEHYPLAEQRPDLVTTGTGAPFDRLTVANLASGRAGQADIAITPAGLRRQAEIARDVGRTRLAENFERGAELVAVPDDVLLATYELLRPGRSGSKDDLLEAAARLRQDYGAERVATLLEEASAVYERRGLFRRRF